MAYTNAWDESQPQGTAAANTLDDIIRQLKVDIRERMNSALVVDWAADPIVSSSAQKTITLGWDAVRSPSYSALWNRQSSYMNMTGEGYVILPVQYRWRVTKVEVLVNKNAAAQLSCTVDERFFNTSQFGAGSYGPIVNSSTGNQTVTIYSNSAGFFVSDQSSWVINIDPGSSFQWNFIGARINFYES